MEDEIAGKSREPAPRKRAHQVEKEGEGEGEMQLMKTSRRSGKKKPAAGDSAMEP